VTCCARDERASGVARDPAFPVSRLHASVQAAREVEPAGFAVVPFSAFGVRSDEGWFRLSVGAVTPAEIAAALPRVERALAALR